MEILHSLGVKDSAPMFEVWNKLDLVDEATHERLIQQAQARDNVFAVSALTGAGLDLLLGAISAAFDEEKTERSFILRFDEGRKRAWLHAEGVVTAETEGEDGLQVTVRWTARQEKRYREL